MTLLLTIQHGLAASGAPRRQVVRMGNKATGGPFSPLVNVVRGIVGEKDFNKLRGKAISLHSQGALTQHPAASVSIHSIVLSVWPLSYRDNE